MVTDRGVAPFLRAEELESAGSRLRVAAPLGVLAAAPTRSRRPRRRPQARSRRRADGSASISRPGRRNRRYGPEKLLKRLELLGPDLVFANEASWTRSAARSRATSCSSAAPTGSRWTARITRRWTAEVVDTTGAGDALAAGFLVGGPSSPRRRLRAACRSWERCRDPVAPEVREALRRRAPVVALETTLVAHGFPAGEGAAVGLESAQRVRDAGAVPATVGILDGALRVGLSDAELERFTADSRKVGPRDLAAAVVQGAVGATTVGGTLAACRAVGIGFMGTGGIGGVHRGDRTDVSADLHELAATEVLVVSSGIKSLLDVPATRKCWRAWASRCSGSEQTRCRFSTQPVVAHRSPARVESAEEAAAVARTHWRLKRRSGLLLAQPPPTSLDHVEQLIEQALAAADEQGVTGPAVTPFVLAFLHEQSGGRTLEVNRELVLENAQLAAEVAVAYARIAA